MKLYIPTCTQNLTNILTTESISPYSFYEKREFGNKRFYKIEANNLDNNIILYSKYPSFVVDNTEIERNYPLVIEIETADYKEGKFKQIYEQEGFEIYYSNSTIYLNQYNCVIYFQTQEELDYSLFQLEQSSEAKYGLVYQKTLKIRNTSNDNFQWNQCLNTNIDDTEFNLDSLKQDIFINKIKGLVVCYLIGSRMSVSKEVAELKIINENIKKILSAIYFAENKSIIDTQKKRLDSLVNQFYALSNFNEIEKNARYNIESLSKLLPELHKELTINDKINFLRDLGVLDKVCTNHQDKLRILHNIVEEKEELLVNFKSGAKKQKEVREQKYNDFLNKISADIQKIIDSEMIIAKSEMIDELFYKNDNRITVKYDKTINETSTFYDFLINSLLQEEYKQKIEQGETKHRTIAIIGGKGFKNYFEKYKDASKWEGSEYQSYINNLLEYLRNPGEYFDISKTTHLPLKSFAAFCCQGHKGIDDLINYMQQTGFTEFSFALGLYGITNGFANLPKSFTNELINNYKNYDVFCDQLHNLIFDYKLSSTIDFNLEESLNTKKSFINYNLMDFTNCFAKLVSIKNEAYLKLIAINSDKKQKNYNSDKEFLNEIYEIIGENNKEKYKKDITEALDWLKTGKEPKYSLKQERVPQEKNTNYVKSLLEDRHWIEECSEYVDVDYDKLYEIKKLLKKDLIYFLDNYQEYYIDSKGQRTKGRYYREDKSNKEVLDNLRQFLIDRKTIKFKTNQNFQNFVNKVYSENIKIDDIIDYLREKYVI